MRRERDTDVLWFATIPTVMLSLPLPAAAAAAPPPVRAALEAELKATAADLKTARAAMAKAKGMLGGARASAELGAAGRTERP